MAKILDFQKKRFEKLQQESNIKDAYGRMLMEKMNRQVERLFKDYYKSGK